MEIQPASEQNPTALAQTTRSEVSQPIYAGRSRKRGQLTPYLFILPFFVVYAIFLLYPVVAALQLSFFKAIGLGSRTFVGLSNYEALASDPRFLRALINTTIYALGSVFILSPLALLVALAVRSFLVPSPNAKSFYRIAFYVPNVTSFVVIALMFGIIFEKDFGVLNGVLSWFGLPKLPWLRDESLAMPSIIMVGIWTFLGINSLFFLAGLQNIPEELNEAAAIDGAGRGQIFRFITLPLLRPTILFVIIQAIIFSYQIFEIPYLLTGGGPSDSTLTVVMYLYQIGFSQFNLGYASAIGYALAVISIGLALTQFPLFRAFRNE